MRVLRKDKYRVVIYPDPKVTRENIETVCRAIKRRVEPHDGIAEVQVVHREMYVCTHCEKQWDENVFGEPRCCPAARKEFFTDPVAMKYFTDGHDERIYKCGSMWVRLSRCGGGKWGIGSNSLPAHDFLDQMCKYGPYFDTKKEAQELLDVCAKHAGWALVTKEEYKKR